MSLSPDARRRHGSRDNAGRPNANCPAKYRAQQHIRQNGHAAFRLERDQHAFAMLLDLGVLEHFVDRFDRVQFVIIPMIVTVARRNSRQPSPRLTVIKRFADADAILTVPQFFSSIENTTIGELNRSVRTVDLAAIRSRERDAAAGEGR